MKLRLLHVSPPVLAVEQLFDRDRVPRNSARGTARRNQEATATTHPPVRVESQTFALAISERTSTSWFCHYRTVPVLLAKLQHVFGFALENMEEPQIVRYAPGQQFSWHYDEVPLSQSQSQQSLDNDNGGQRLATLLVYLNTLEEGGGGGTVFRDLHMDSSNSDVPLRVRPVQGTALLFFPALANGTPDARTLHQGEILAKNQEKRIVQVWVHERAYRAAVPPNNRQQEAVAAVDRVRRRLGYDDDGVEPAVVSSSAEEEEED